VVRGFGFDERLTAADCHRADAELESERLNREASNQPLGTKRREWKNAAHLI
jgi:hypothetical protein